MATTSIWRVNGWLGKVLIYIENPDKTENPAAYEKQGMDGKEAQGLSDVIEYAVQQKKTGKIAVDDEDVPVMQRFVSGVNCSPTTARDEMIAVKKRFGKEEGTVAYHGYQSFAPGEATPEMAHEIGLKLAKALWGEKYQVLVATHLDKAHHLHNHFVVNTVSFLDGIKYHRTEKDLSYVSMVFQKVYLFNDTIENNIKFGKPNASHAEVVAAAKRACCHDFIEALPQGYETMIGEAGSTLSGGEKQRISIARAILKDAPIIILDEATSSVDPENEKALLDAIFELTKNKTLISIAHRLSTVRTADQIVVIDQGHIVQHGTHEELAKKEGVYRTFLECREKSISWKL